MVSKPCSAEGCNNGIFAKKLCWSHQYLRTDIKGSGLARKPLKKRSTKATVNIPNKKEELTRQWEFFLKIWNERPHYSEVSGDWLGSEPRSLYFHHILPKSQYPSAKFDEYNIILLTWEEHDNVERNPKFFTKINALRESLLKKYPSK